MYTFGTFWGYFEEKSTDFDGIKEYSDTSSKGAKNPSPFRKSEVYASDFFCI